MIESLNQGREYMNTQFKAIFTSILYAITIAAAPGVVEAGKGNGGGGQSGGYGSGNGAMYGSGQTTGPGYETPNSNQYRYQHQNQYRNGNGGIAQGDRQSFDSGTGQYSNERYLNQEDFQTWLNQNQSKAQNHNHNQVQNMAQDGL